MVDIHNVKNIHTNFHIIELKIRKPSNIALFTSTNGGVGQKTLSMHYINTIHTCKINPCTMWRKVCKELH